VLLTPIPRPFSTKHKLWFITSQVLLCQWFNQHGTGIVHAMPMKIVQLPDICKSHSVGTDLYSMNYVGWTLDTSMTILTKNAQHNYKHDDCWPREGGSLTIKDDHMCVPNFADKGCFLTTQCVQLRSAFSKIGPLFCDQRCLPQGPSLRLV
jgi:hypothetical protein